MACRFSVTAYCRAQASNGTHLKSLRRADIRRKELLVPGGRAMIHRDGLAMVDSVVRSGELQALRSEAELARKDGADSRAPPFSG